ncbi:MAG TPA: PP2C family protein-serine/threonine phosphatase [Candidatus Polarisedimenticolaceae bacterium]
MSRRDPDTPLLRTVFDDARRPGITRSIRDDVATLRRFYLTDAQKRKIEQAHALGRAWLTSFYLLRALLLRLSPNRRVLLAACLAIAAFLNTSRVRVGEGVDLTLSFWPLAVLGLLALLALELKDKLVARDEIELARAVQLSLLPRAHPRLGAWRVWSASVPANDVGGDLADYVPVAEGRLGLALGDVAGKGMAAALLAAKLQATLRALAPSHAGLDGLGRAVNAILVRDGLENRFATLFYAEVDQRSGRVRFLNAGHNPALVIRGGAVETLPANGIPLGMFDGARYAESAVTLSPGDTLVVHSDGVNEAEDPDGEAFGDARLHAIVGRDGALPPEALGRAILEAVAAFQGPGKPRDDQSVLVLRYAPEPVISDSHEADPVA